jgi:hypothetical protein
MCVKNVHILIFEAGIFFFGQQRYQSVSEGGKKIEVDNSASSGEPEKYTKYVSFSWPPLEAAVSIFNVIFLLK